MEALTRRSRCLGLAVACWLAPAAGAQPSPYQRRLDQAVSDLGNPDPRLRRLSARLLLDAQEERTIAPLRALHDASRDAAVRADVGGLLDRIGWIARGEEALRERTWKDAQAGIRPEEALRRLWAHPVSRRFLLERTAHPDKALGVEIERPAGHWHAGSTVTVRARLTNQSGQPVILAAPLPEWILLAYATRLPAVDIVRAKGLEDESGDGPLVSAHELAAPESKPLPPLPDLRLLAPGASTPWTARPLAIPPESVGRLQVRASLATPRADSNDWPPPAEPWIEVWRRLGFKLTGEQSYFALPLAPASEGLLVLDIEGLALETGTPRLRLALRNVGARTLRIPRLDGGDPGVAYLVVSRDRVVEQRLPLTRNPVAWRRLALLPPGRAWRFAIALPRLAEQPAGDYEAQVFLGPYTDCTGKTWRLASPITGLVRSARHRLRWAGTK